MLLQCNWINCLKWLNLLGPSKYLLRSNMVFCNRLIQLLPQLMILSNLSWIWNILLRILVNKQFIFFLIVIIRSVPLFHEKLVLIVYVNKTFQRLNAILFIVYLRDQLVFVNHCSLKYFFFIEFVISWFFC